MELSNLVPAGVPRGLARLRWRVHRILSEGPFFFLGVVLAVAVIFRVVIGWAKG